MLGISSGLFSLFLGNEIVNEGDDIIDDTFGGEVNL